MNKAIITFFPMVVGEACFEKKEEEEEEHAELMHAT